MGMLARWLERRATKTTGGSPQNPSYWVQKLLGCGQETAAGETVNPETALGISAYFACVRNIAEDTAKLPLILYDHQADGGKRRRPDHYLYPILHDDPNPEMCSMVFWETIMQHALAFKGGFAEIEWRNDGRVKALHVLDPNSVRIERQKDKSLMYFVAGTDGRELPLSPADVLHIHGLGYDGITSWIIAEIGKESFGAALAMQKYAGAFFGNGTWMCGALEFPNALKPDQIENLRKSFEERHAGAGNAWRMMILPNGGK